MTKAQIKAWQEFEAKYKVSENYSEASQIIFMAYEAGISAQQTVPL